MLRYIYLSLCGYYLFQSKLNANYYTFVLLLTVLLVENKSDKDNITCLM